MLHVPNRQVPPQANFLTVDSLCVSFGRDLPEGTAVRGVSFSL